LLRIVLVLSENRGERNELTDEEKQVFEAIFVDINNNKSKIVRISTQLTDKEPQHAINYEDEGAEEEPVDDEGEDYSDEGEEYYDDMAEDNVDDKDTCS
jgi:hypothetical protein